MATTVATFMYWPDAATPLASKTQASSTSRMPLTFASPTFEVPAGFRIGVAAKSSVDSGVPLSSVTATSARPTVPAFVTT